MGEEEVSRNFSSGRKIKFYLRFKYVSKDSISIKSQRQYNLYYTSLKLFHTTISWRMPWAHQRWETLMISLYHTITVFCCDDVVFLWCHYKHFRCVSDTSKSAALCADMPSLSAKILQVNISTITRDKFATLKPLQTNYFSWKMYNWNGWH